MLMKSEHRKELVSEIRSLAQSQGLNTVFTTFLEITANSLAAQTDPENAEKREQRYQEMASTMTPELLSSYARMLALLFLTVREYRDDPCDILGGIYHELNLNNEWNGQYFTPDDVCRLMAQITLPSDELSANDGPITINEPTCGSGTMVIGAIWAMQRKEFDYRHNTFFVAQDIDIRCVWMAYIDLWSRQLQLPFRAEATFGPLSMRMTTFLPSISIGITMVEKLPSCSALQNTIPNGMKVRRSASASMPQTRMKPNITRHIWQKGIMNHEFKSNKTNLGGGCGNGPDRTPKNHWQRCFLYGKIR